MSAEPNPWGIIVTRTLHLSPPGNMDRTACWNARVAARMDALREQYQNVRGPALHDLPSIYGYADGRPVCERCIIATDGLIARLTKGLAEARAYNDDRVTP